MWSIHSSKGFKQLINPFIPRFIRSFLHKGDQYICPFCNYQSKDLAPIGRNLSILKEKQIVGSGYRFAGCYNCGSSDRERLVYLYLSDCLKVFDSPKIENILHIAPERNLSNKLYNHGFKNYICGDLFADSYKYPKYVQKINLLNIPFEKETFDLIICNHVLEHIHEEKQALEEIYRVLKKQGQAILQVPISNNSATTFEDPKYTTPKEREKHFGQFDHIRIYGQDYTNRLAQIGFIVDKVNISSNYTQYGLNKNEYLYIVRKINQK